MLIVSAANTIAGVVEPRISQILEFVSSIQLQEIVETVSIPRHFVKQNSNNQIIAKWIWQQLSSYGYQVTYQGQYANILAMLPGYSAQACILVGAHYDSVAETFGADDNGSALAALLVTAKMVAKYIPQKSICFVAFNREEEGLLGSQEFVTNYGSHKDKINISQAHILEMVGYSQNFSGSQRVPPGLPIRIPNRGNFIGLIGNHRSHRLLDQTLITAKTYLPNFPVLGLKIYFKLEKVFSVLRRSDHAPFWEAGIPALMWTDTAEFRNPNYHLPTDTPDTLDYEFLRQVTQLLLASVIGHKHKMIS
jgi:Zn-dependent M28 family amino/carboxypeptidase